MRRTMKEQKEYNEWLKQQSREQLELALRNAENSEEQLQEKLFLLTGCPKFGSYDGLDGRCVDCFYNNFRLTNRCHDFSEMIHLYDSVPEKDKNKDYWIFFKKEFE